LSHEVLVEHGDWSCEFTDWSSDQTVEAARRLLSKKKQPTAVVCASDHIAMLMVRVAVEKGLQVPRDLSVTGFDDVTAAALYNPPLTTVAQPFEAMGRAAVRHLLQLPEKPLSALPVSLILRDSTTVPRRI
jgi:LacI family transcriptional regulator